MYNGAVLPAATTRGLNFRCGDRKITTMLWLDRWEFCRKLDCPYRASQSHGQDLVFLRQWLQQSKRDPHQLLSLRTLLSQEISEFQISRMTDEQVVEHVAPLLVSGRLHVHAPGLMVTAPEFPFCKKMDCPHRQRASSEQDLIFVRRWLRQARKDVRKMFALQTLLPEELNAFQFSKMSDEQIVAQLGELMASGDLHVHAPDQTDATSPSGSSAAYPLADRKPTQQPTSTQPESDPPTFPSDLDGAAQAAALSAAADSGQPFCPQ